MRLSRSDSFDEGIPCNERLAVFRLLDILDFEVEGLWAVPC